MKKRSSTTMLSLLAGLTALASVVLCLAQIHYSRQLRATQAQLLQVNKNRNLMNRLASDLYSYSKTNSAIKPLLDSVGLQPVQQ